MFDCYSVQTLTKLTLIANDINADKIKLLAAVLPENKVIYQSDFGVFYKVNLYFDVQTLTTLELFENDIGDDGMQHLANGLKQNTVSHHKRIHSFSESLQTLLKLSLNDNELGTDGAKHIGDMLRENKVIFENLLENHPDLYLQFRL